MPSTVLSQTRSHQDWLRPTKGTTPPPPLSPLGEATRSPPRNNDPSKLLRALSIELCHLVPHIPRAMQSRKAAWAASRIPTWTRVHGTKPYSAMSPMEANGSKEHPCCQTGEQEAVAWAVLSPPQSSVVLDPEPSKVMYTRTS